MNNAPRGPLGILGDEDGIAPVGTALLARPNAITDADGIDFDSVEFQWTRNAEPITGATGPKYTVTEFDRGADIGLRYSYIDGQGNKETVIAKPISVPDPVTDAFHAIYHLVFGRRGDGAGMAFYAQHYRNGVPVSELVADMEDNKAKGAT